MNRSEKTGKKSRLSVILCGGMILPAAFLFATGADHSYIFILACLGLIVSLLFARPVKYTDRAVIYSIVGAAVIAVFGDLIFKIDARRMGLVGTVLRSNLTGPFFIYLSLAATFFRQNGYVYGICATLSMLVMILGGDMLNLNYKNENMLILYGMVHNHIYRFFSVAATMQIAALLVAFTAGRVKFVKSKAPFKWTKRLVFLILLAVIPALSFSALMLYRRYENRLKEIELYLLRVGMRKRRYSGNIIFSDRVNLNRTTSPEARQEQDKILLRAVSDSPPGYLRGRAYTRYSGGCWDEPEDRRERPFKLVQAEGIMAVNTFFYYTMRQYRNSVTVYPAHAFSTNVLIAPGNSSQFGLVADRLNFTDNGVILPELWEKDGGYTCYSDKPVSFAAFPGPSDPFGRKEYFDVPDNLRERLKVFLKGLFPEPSGGDKMKDSEVIRKVSGFLLHNFKYSLNTRISPDKDPVLNFLEVSREGHCELFASAAVLLLREYGIPCRYVTGFICSEAHPSGEYYVARLGNAHAWLEAFPRDKNKWILVEPTPPSGRPNFKHRWGTAETWLDRITQFFRKTLADMRRGYFARAIINFVKAPFLFLPLITDTPSGGILAFFAVLLSGFLYYRRKKRHKATKPVRYPPELRLLRNDYKKFERKVTGATGVRRPSRATISEWALLLPDNKALREALRAYQKLRYRERSPSKTEIREFKKICGKALHGLRRRSFKDSG